MGVMDSTWTSDRASLVRDWRAWAIVGSILLISALDIALPPDVILQTFLAIPVVASAILGRPVFTAAAGGLALLGGAVSWWVNGYTLVDGGRRSLIVLLIAVASVLLAATVRRANDDRNRDRALFRLLAENASDIVYAAGPDGLVTWVSPTVEQALGWRPRDLIGTSMMDLVHKDDHATIGVVRDRTYSGEHVEHPPGGILIRMRGKDGEYRWVGGRVRPVTTSTGEPAGVVGGISVVDELVEAREEARFNEANLQATLRSLLDPHVLLRATRGPSGTVVDFWVVDVNDAACEDVGLTRDRIQGRYITEYVEGSEGLDLVRLCARSMDSDVPLVLDDYGLSTDGRRRRVDLRGVRVGDSLSLTWRDVTERHESARRLAESEERYRLLAENSSDVVFLTRDRAIEWVSPSLTSALGWDPDDWRGHPFELHAHPDDLERLRQRRQEVIEGSTRVIAVRISDREGAFHWIELHAGPFYDADGRLEGVVGSFRVTDDEVAAQEELQRRAQLDDLTGAFTREEMMRRVGELRRSSDRPAAILYCDLDRFKPVNDTRGHAAGDRILVEIVRRIRDVVRGEDVVARLGGDEFLVVLPGLGEPSRVQQVADEIRERAALPVDVGDGHEAVTMSIGVVILQSGDAVSDAIERADAAMYRAKREGGNRIAFA